MAFDWTIDRWLTVVGAIGIPSGLLSWLITRHYYKRADKKRTPTFVVQSTRALVEPGLAAIPGLAVHHKGLRVGANGITEAKIHFWNSGTLPILRDDVLDPYTITLPARILTHSILKSTRDVVGLQASVKDENQPNVLTLDFAVLEPGDGATLWVVYDAPGNAGIEFNGTCLDARKPTVLPPDTIYSMPPFKRLGQTYGRFFLVILVPVVGGLALSGIQCLWVPLSEFRQIFREECRRNRLWLLQCFGLLQQSKCL
jgi:hypothetical protein